ncbi:MAG: DeoR/GlpR transcriptional regulator [Chitinophagales bacterium]|nr:DeoR/GlpR transcriptional regulator [Hyphomicrobiales bacterium]
MLSTKRQSDILRRVRQQGSCSVVDLASHLAVTTETVRRNLKSLVDAGALTKFHGGVMLPETVAEPVFQRRMKINQKAKQLIAKLAVSRIKNGDTVFLDNGTTTTYVAEALAARSALTIVTNAAEIACRVARQNGNRVFMAGGELNADDIAAFGSGTLDFIRQFQVRYALISIGGINERGELLDFHLFEADVARAAMQQAAETWVIADKSKFGRNAPVRVCGLDAVQVVITDAIPPPEFLSLLAEAKVALVTP